jgi:hypothetical protein
MNLRRLIEPPEECLIGASSLAPCDGATSEKGQPIDRRRLRPNVRDGSRAAVPGWLNPGPICSREPTCSTGSALFWSGHERSSGLRQRTSAAPPGQTSAYLCIPLSSLLMPCAYARTIERRREVFYTRGDSKRTHKQLTTSLSGSATNDSNRRSTAGASCVPKSVIKITAPRSESQDCRDK